MSRFFTLMAAALMSAAFAAPASAHDGDRHGHEFHHRDRGHHRFHDGFLFFGPAYPYPYAGYGYRISPWGYGYFCATANAFYPFVASCPVAWQLLLVQ